MTRLSKFPAKIPFLFCTLFCLSPCFVFSQQVDTAWVRRYNGPGNGDDKAVAIAVDSSGNVYVTGSSFDSTTGYDFCTIKYLPNGDTAWVRRYNSPANRDDAAASIGLDSSGNVYVTGTSGNNGNSDCVTIKYSPAGDILWVRRFNTQPPNVGISCDSAVALKVDKAGNVYVAGSDWFCGLDLPEGSFLTLKYDTDGNLLWSKYDYQVFYFNYAQALDLDGDGNVYVTGRSFDNRDTSDYLTVKYTALGTKLWEKRYNSPANNNDFARAVAVDSSGNAYVTGLSNGDILTIKYDSLGNQLWTQRRGTFSVVSNVNGGYDLVVDKEGNTFVIGQVWDVEYWVWYTIKYDSSGSELWSRPGGLGFYEPSFALDIDTDGNTYAVGGQYAYSIIKYDPQGNPIWSKNYSATPKDVIVDSKENVYVIGNNAGSGTGLDFVTVKYSPLPQLKGDLNLDGAVSAADVVLMLNCAFTGDAIPAAPSACDINCDGTISATDVVILLNMVFASAPAPC